MTKKELIDAVAAKTGVSKKDAGAVVDAALNEIVTALANDDAVQIAGFGTFETRKREARTGINPKTKEKIVVPATTVPAFKAGKTPKFKAGKALKDAVK